MNNQTITVHIALGEENIRVGQLWCHTRKGRESASFEYDKNWLKHPERFALEPALTLSPGTFHTPQGMRPFGSIGDSAPDRWGRVLMRRNEAARAKHAKQTPRTLFESDYLLGVNDQARQGALRFSTPPQESQFLSTTEQAIPPRIGLPKLLSASAHILAHKESAEDLQCLLAPGASLGGARPKASIYDNQGNLSIAKFPRKDDEFNTVRWEAVALTLAKKAGIHTPLWQLITLDDKPVLIIQRFERHKQIRYPFLSAMSMLGAQDHEPHSYLDIAYAIAQHGAHPEKDMAELWRRIIFTIMISNTDDHLRNHGFLYQRNQGWQLSPAYDLNPTPSNTPSPILATSINFDEPTADIDIALSVIKDFRLSKTQAHQIIKEVKDGVKTWPKVAMELGLSTQEIARMAPAFQQFPSIRPGTAS